MILDAAVPATTWDGHTSDPLADLRAWTRGELNRPYKPFAPILSPAQQRQYDWAVKVHMYRIDREWRFQLSRRLRPMHVAYRRRTRAGSRRRRAA